MDALKEREANEKIFWTIFQGFDERLAAAVYLIKEHNVSPLIIETFVRALVETSKQTGWGTVMVRIEDNKVTVINGQSNYKIDQKIGEEEEKSQLVLDK